MSRKVGVMRSKFRFLTISRAAAFSTDWNGRRCTTATRWRMHYMSTFLIVFLEIQTFKNVHQKTHVSNFEVDSILLLNVILKSVTKILRYKPLLGGVNG